MLRFNVKLRNHISIKRDEIVDLLKFFAEKPLPELREIIEKWMDEKKFPKEKRTNLLFEVLKADLPKIADEIKVDKDEETISLLWNVAYGDACTIHYLLPILLHAFTEKSIKILSTSDSKKTCDCGNFCTRRDSESTLVHTWYKHQREKILQNTYSWGELYETLKKMSDNGDEHKDPLFTKAFELFAKLDNAVGKKEVKKILQEYPFTEEELNRINSPCLDGIIGCIKNSSIHRIYSKYSIETLKYFLDRRICVRSVSRAILNDRVDILKLFIERGVDIQIQCKKYLQYACYGFSPKCVRFLINKDSISEQAFVLAVQSDYTDITQLFIDNGIDINCWNGRPLLNAFLAGNEKQVKFLLEKGAKVMQYGRIYSISKDWEEWDES